MLLNAKKEYYNTSIEFSVSALDKVRHRPHQGWPQRLYKGLWSKLVVFLQIKEMYRMFLNKNIQSKFHQKKINLRLKLIVFALLLRYPELLHKCIWESKYYIWHIQFINNYIVNLNKMECRRKRPHIFVGVKRNNKHTIHIRSNHCSRLGAASTTEPNAWHTWCQSTQAAQLWPVYSLLPGLSLYTNKPVAVFPFPKV